MTEDKRKLVIAENFHEFRNYARENRLNIPDQAVYVKDEYSTMGIDPRRVEVVWLPGAVARRDFNRIRAAMVARGCTEGLPRPIHELDGAVLGDKFRVGDQMFTLAQIDTDVEGSQQWTMVRRGSRTDREMEARAQERTRARRAGDTFFEMPPGIMQGYRDPAGRSLTFDQVANMTRTGPMSTPPEELYEIGPRIEPRPGDQQSVCKCGYRAPELGPHPDCPIHGHDSPDRMDTHNIGHDDPIHGEPNAGWPPQDS